jgi:hypothetical protein
LDETTGSVPASAVKQLGWSVLHSAVEPIKQRLDNPTVHVLHFRDSAVRWNERKMERQRATRRDKKEERNK